MDAQIGPLCSGGGVVSVLKRIYGQVGSGHGSRTIHGPLGIGPTTRPTPPAPSTHRSRRSTATNFGKAFFWKVGPWALQRRHPRFHALSTKLEGHALAINGILYATGGTGRRSVFRPRRQDRGWRG